MCWFVTVAMLPKLEPDLRRLAHEEGLHAQPQLNTWIDAALRSTDRLPQGMKLWSVVTGMCSCDLVVGEETGRTLHERKRRIRERPNEGTIPLREDLRRMIAALADLGTKPIAFVVHTYRGALDEEFDVASGPRITPDEMRDHATRFPPDALCVVRVAPRYA